MSTPQADAATVTAWVGDAVMAPSMHNAQPWQFRYVPATGELRLRMDLTRSMPHTDSHHRSMHVSCGAALFNLRVAAAHAGWTAHVLEQARANVLIRPDVRYVGPAERHLSTA